MTRRPAGAGSADGSRPGVAIRPGAATAGSGWGEGRRWLVVLVLATGLVAGSACAGGTVEETADAVLRDAPDGEGEGPSGEGERRPAQPSELPEPAATSPDPATQAPPLRHLKVEVVASYPHDPEAFTQGLLLDPVDPSVVLESTGRYGSSELRRVDLATGRPIRRVPLADDLFAEGLARVPGGEGEPDRLVQLTWRAGVAKVWDAATLEELGEHRYGGEGWGLCYDASGKRLVMSNGSPWLSFRDPGTMAPVGGGDVRQDGRPLGYLNELECVDGKVWANLYGSDLLVEIDPDRGVVTAVVDASGLLAASERPGTDVLNGIAYDPTDGTFLLTGKLWPKLFRVRFVER